MASEQVWTPLGEPGGNAEMMVRNPFREPLNLSISENEPFGGTLIKFCQTPGYVYSAFGRVPLALYKFYSEDIES